MDHGKLAWAVREALSIVDSEDARFALEHVAHNLIVEFSFDRESFMASCGFDR